MKHVAKSIAVIMLICLLGAIFAGCRQDPNEPAAPAEAITIPDIPPSGSGIRIGELAFAEGLKTDAAEKTVKVYRAEPVEIGAEYVSSLAEKVGIAEGTISENESTIVFAGSDGASVMAFKASGSVFIHFVEEGLPGDDSDAAADTEYLNKAKAWLENAGLLTEDYLEKEPTVCDNGIVTKMVDGSPASYPTLKTVTFMFRDLDGIEVGGVSPRITVDLSLDGKVVSATKIQRKFTVFAGGYKLASLEEAKERLENGEGAFYIEDEVQQSGVINEVSLQFYNREVADSSPYLVPVYVFKGTSGDTEFTAVVTALSADSYNIEQPGTADDASAAEQSGN